MSGAHTPGPLYLCRGGHIVRSAWRAGLTCGKCKANDRRRIKRAEARARAAKATGSAA